MLCSGQYRFVSGSIPNMCSRFSGTYTEITQLSMHFNTEGFDAARLCECSISLANKCEPPADSPITNRCPFGRDVQRRTTIVDNSIISCGRGYIQQHVQGRSDNYTIAFKINRNHSDSITSDATIIRHTIRQFGTYDGAYMSGTITLSGTLLTCTCMPFKINVSYHARYIKATHLSASR